MVSLVLKLVGSWVELGFRTRHTELILKQRRTIALSIKTQLAKSHTKSIDASKLTTGHFIALQREEIQFHPPEHRRKLP